MAIKNYRATNRMAAGKVYDAVNGLRGVENCLEKSKNYLTNYSTKKRIEKKPKTKSFSNS